MPKKSEPVVDPLVKIPVAPPKWVRVKNGVTTICWADGRVSRHFEVDEWVESKAKR
jgi:hypothetical protein